MSGWDARRRGAVGVSVALAAALSACATSPYRRAGNAGEVAAALARSQPPAPSPRSLVFLVLGCWVVSAPLERAVAPT